VGPGLPCFDGGLSSRGLRTFTFSLGLDTQQTSGVDVFAYRGGVARYLLSVARHPLPLTRCPSHSFQLVDRRHFFFFRYLKL